MSIIKVVVLFVVLCIVQLVVKCQKCEKTGYSYSYLTNMICTDIKDTFPKFSRPVDNIKCINCNIPVLDENTLHNFKGDTFNISFSHVTTLTATAFNSFTNKNSVSTILLNDNDITSIAPQLFGNLSRLSIINLKNNKISNVENGMFANINLTLLDLSVNRISNLKNIVSNLHVITLNVSFNQIVEIQEDTFDDIVLWTGMWRTSNPVLDLSSNLIEHIKPNTFKAGSPSNKLTTLYLRNNKITKIENGTFSQLSYLTYLNLADNGITDLYLNSFKGLTKLTTLILKNNEIKEIPQITFSNLLLLENLDLSENRIQTLNDYTFSGLAQLTKLNISHNQLKTLDELCLLPIGKVATLDISNNALKTLSLQSILEHHYKLRVIVLNDNYWSCKDLVQMYKLLNQKVGGFHFASHHFDVPNLHGIACSRIDADIYDYKSFDNFLDVISQDQAFEDVYDSKGIKDDINVQDILGVVKTITGIYYLVLTIMLMFMISFLLTMGKHVCNYLSSRNILNDKFSLKYAQNQDTVALI